MIDQVQPRSAELSDDRRVSNRRLTERRAHQATATACPRCGSHYINRSATRWWERPLRWITPLVPFRCRTCEWRGWRRSEWLQVRAAGASTDAHADIQPPSTTTSEPVTNDEAGDARNSAAVATSRGSPNRFIGIRRRN